MFFKAFKMKKQGLKCFFKLINNTTLKRGFKRLSGLYAALRDLMNSWFRFLMSRTGYLTLVMTFHAQLQLDGDRRLYFNLSNYEKVTHEC